MPSRVSRRTHHAAPGDQGRVHRLRPGARRVVRAGAAKHVPDAIFEAPEETLIGFLQGLFDADGCAVSLQNGTRYVASAAGPRNCCSASRTLASLGIAGRIYQTGTKKDSFSYTRKDGSTASYGSDGPSFDLRITGRSLREFGARIGSAARQGAELLTIIASTTGTTRTRRSVLPPVSHAASRHVHLTEPRNHSYIVGGAVVANCSEYVHLDNSSCNLASINLLKFLRKDDTFDVERFQQITELIITAMGYLHLLADFPTDKISITTRAYRQLGIGYANLGALLMATGHAYDSEDGRAIAGAITSLMTGTAYRRSAELAKVVGPYDGYARNEIAHKRVMASTPRPAEDPAAGRHRRRDPRRRQPRLAGLPRARRDKRVQKRTIFTTRANWHNWSHEWTVTPWCRAGPGAGQVQKLVGGGSMQIVTRPSRAP